MNRTNVVVSALSAAAITVFVILFFVLLARWVTPSLLGAADSSWFLPAVILLPVASSAAWLWRRSRQRKP